MRVALLESDLPLLIIVILTFAECKWHFAVAEAEWEIVDRSLIALCGWIVVQRQRFWFCEKHFYGN
jgi:hypothetical protein